MQQTDLYSLKHEGYNFSIRNNNQCFILKHNILHYNSSLSITLHIYVPALI